MRRHDAYRPHGAVRLGDGSVAWNVWAPLSDSVSLVAMDSFARVCIAMASGDDGWFHCQLPSVAEGLRYVYRLADGAERPDPASRSQPEGVHGPSAVFSPGARRWSDAAWRGMARDQLAIYEAHVGAFTPEGTFDTMVPRLPQLIALGVTAVELMPVAQFPGRRDWGYDAAYPFAVQESYGGPGGLQRFVDAAHAAGLAVLLDVVYNHFGPEGSYVGSFGPYFTDRYRTPWGNAVNYDGPDCDSVRRFVVDNARMWVRDFHVDGLRLDAVHAIYDRSPRHILQEIQAAVHEEGARADRIVHVFAESDDNDVRLIRPASRGGIGLDGVWSDDFHHSLHALLTGERDGYYADFGQPAQLAKACNRVFVYDGGYSVFRRRRHGTRVGAADRTRFVVCVQNHDHVGNRARGDRLSALVPPAAQRLACGLLLLSPCVPALFMGEEYGETRPFPYFCSFGDAELVEAVRQGRRREFAAMEFRWDGGIPDPQDEQTFRSATLAWQWPDGSWQAQLRRLYADLLAARRRWPALADRRRTAATLLHDRAKASAGVASPLLAIARGGPKGVWAVANLAAQAVPAGYLPLAGRQLLLCTENPCYGGTRLWQPGCESLMPYELLIFGRRGETP